MEEETKAYRVNVLPSVVNSYWQSGDEKPASPVQRFRHSSTPKQKILKTPLAFQPNNESSLKKLKTRRPQGMASGPEKGGQSLAQCWERHPPTPGGHSCPSSASEDKGHQRPAKGRDKSP